MEFDIQQLANEVAAVFGVEAVCAANDRAFDRAEAWVDADADEWLRVFDDAFKAELRRLLQRH